MHAADHHLRNADARRFREQRLEQDDERLGAAQAEQLAGRDAGAQALLEGVGAGELGKDGDALGIGGRASAAGFGLRLQPGAAGRIVDVADVPADAAAIGGFQGGDVGFRGHGVEAVPARVELGHLDGWREAERIEPGLEIAACAIGLGQRSVAGARWRHRGASRAGASPRMCAKQASRAPGSPPPTRGGSRSSGRIGRFIGSPGSRGRMRPAGRQSRGAHSGQATRGLVNKWFHRIPKIIRKLSAHLLRIHALSNARPGRGCHVWRREHSAGMGEGVPALSIVGSVCAPPSAKRRIRRRRRHVALRDKKSCSWRSCARRSQRICAASRPSPMGHRGC